MAFMLSPGSSPTGSPGLVQPAAAEPAPAPTASPDPGRGPVVIAVVGGVSLREVSPRAIAVAFHEASSPQALRMQPVGRCRVCRNRHKFAPPRALVPGRWYVVMDPRGRPFPATSAVDIVLPEGERVLAPVTGTVRAVKRYRLYGRHPDFRMAINPAGIRHRQVVIIHLRSVTLERGDRVVAGQTVLGRARRFPFRSQVDRYVRGGRPHVHIEVKGAESSVA